jgi:putative ABC transport system permease protein
MRKVLGAYRSQLIWQFLGEAVLLCLLALILALALVGIFGQVAELPMRDALLLYLWQDKALLSGLLGGTLLLGLLAGSYPAFMLSSFRPVKVLKGSFVSSASGIWLRRVLVVGQFAASIAMLIGTAVVYLQVDFLKSADKGFNPEQVITLDLGDAQLQGNYEALRNELLKDPAILQVAAASSLPGEGFGRIGIKPEGAAEEDVWIVSAMGIDEHFIPVMEMEVVEGRNYDPAYSTDAQENILVNEAFLRETGWDSGLGRRIQLGNSPENQRVIVGVVKDFHFAAMRHQIEPMLIFYNPNATGRMVMRVRTEQLSATLAGIEGNWQKVNPNYPFEYSFFNEDFAAQFASEDRFARLSLGFTWLAILIACLGLLGLSAYAAEQRTREIGIRKILGASTTGLVGLLSREFTWLVIVATVLAAPLAFFAMQNWLADFAYRIDIPWWVFGAAGLLALAVALLTNSFHAVRTARANPAEALRYE